MEATFPLLSVADLKLSDFVGEFVPQLVQTRQIKTDVQISNKDFNKVEGDCFCQPTMETTSSHFASWHSHGHMQKVKLSPNPQEKVLFLCGVCSMCDVLLTMPPFTITNEKEIDVQPPQDPPFSS